MKPSFALPLLTVLTLTGAGCWSRPPAEDSTTPPAQVVVDDAHNACLLLTKADAEAVLGESVLDPLYSGAMSDDRQTSVSSCNYATSAESEADVRVVSLLVRKAATQEEAIRVYENAKTQSASLSGVQPEDVAGLGDRAYWSGGTLTQMNILKDDTWFIVNVRDASGPTLRDEAMDASKRALAKVQ